MGSLEYRYSPCPSVLMTSLGEPRPYTGRNVKAGKYWAPLVSISSTYVSARVEGTQRLFDSLTSLTLQKAKPEQYLLEIRAELPSTHF